MTVGLVLMAGLAALGLLRSGLGGKPALLGDADTTILATKARIASEPSEARVAFVGDSSCLINVDIPTLRAAGIEAVNLGTRVGDLSAGPAQMIDDAIAYFQPDEVVLVVHPSTQRHWSEDGLITRALTTYAVPIQVVECAETTPLAA